MTIKSDRWIRRMAAEHRMIEPFESGQVRGDRDVAHALLSWVETELDEHAIE